MTDLLRAVQTVIVMFMAIVYPLISLHFSYEPTNIILLYTLKILSVVYIDAGVLYIVLKAAEISYFVHFETRAHEDCQDERPMPPYEMAYAIKIYHNQATRPLQHVYYYHGVFTDMLPGLILSSILYFFMQLVVCWWALPDIIQTLLGPTTLSSYFDVRLYTGIRGVNEIQWVYHIVLICSVYAFEIYYQVETLIGTKKNLFFLSAVIHWLLGNVLTFSCFTYKPFYFLMCTRNILSNVPLLHIGMSTVALSQMKFNVTDQHITFMYTFLGYISAGILVLQFLLYTTIQAHESKQEECVRLIGAGVCIPPYSAFTSRILPLSVFTAWFFLDTSGTFPPYFFGPISHNMTETFKHAVQALASFSRYNNTFLLYGQFYCVITSCIGNMLPHTLPLFATLLPLHIALVTYLCMYTGDLVRFIAIPTSDNVDGIPYEVPQQHANTPNTVCASPRRVDSVCTATI